MGISYEDLIKQGATPITPSQGGGLTYEQLVSQGATPVDVGVQTSQAPQQSLGENIGQNVANQWTGAGQKIASSIFGGAQKVGQGDIGNIATGLGESALGTASGAVQAIFAPFTGIIQTALDKTGIHPLDAITPEVKQRFSDFAQAHPEATTNIQDAINVGLAIAGSKGLNEPLRLSSLKGLPSQAVNDAGNLVNGIKQRFATNKFDAALKDVTPSFESATPTAKQKLIRQPDINGSPRIQEGGVLRGRTVTPNNAEQQAAQELANVKGYNPNSTYLAKQNLIEKEIANRAQVLSSSAKESGILIPKKEIMNTVVKAINEVPEKSLLLQRSDPIIQNYTRIVKNAVEQNDGTLEGALNIRKALDAAYKNARGKLAFGSDKIAPLDEVHRTGRNALNELFIQYAKQAKNVAAEESLKGQTNLYRALDQITPRAAREAGSKIGRFGQKHPIVKEGIKTGAKFLGGAAGLGGGYEITKSIFEK